MLIAEGAELDHFRPKKKTTALMVAANAGNLQSTQLLLKAKADLELTDIYGQTAVHHAAMKGKPRNLLELISRSADANQKTHEGWTPLMLAIKNGHPRAVQTILKVVPSDELQLELCDAKGRTALDLARKGSSRATSLEKSTIVKDLLAAGAIDSQAPEADAKGANGSKTDSDFEEESAVFSGQRILA